MSYDIEFTGSLVDNRDLPEITVASSVTKSELTNSYLSSDFEMNINQTVAAYGWDTTGGPATSLSTFYSPTTFFYAIFPVSGGLLNGTYKTVSGGARVGYWAVADSLMPPNGTLMRVQIRTNANNNNSFVISQNNNSTSQTIYSSGSGNFSFVNIDVTLTSNGGSISAFMFGESSWQIDYIRVYTTANVAVAITPSTTIAGTEKTGGIATTFTEATTEDGSPAASGAPKEFGLSVKDGAIEVAKAKLYPSSDSAQSAGSDVTDVKVVTATTNTLDVDAEGLGGPDRLGVGSSIVVENVSDQSEN